MGILIYLQVPYDLTSLQVRAEAFDTGPITLQLQIDSGNGFVCWEVTRAFPRSLQEWFSTSVF